MKTLLLIMMMLTSVSYADEVKFSPEIEGTVWFIPSDFLPDEDTVIFLEISSNFFIRKHYQGSKLTGVYPLEINRYVEIDESHFLFYGTYDSAGVHILRILPNGVLEQTSVDARLKIANIQYYIPRKQ